MSHRGISTKGLQAWTTSKLMQVVRSCAAFATPGSLNPSHQLCEYVEEIERRLKEVEGTVSLVALAQGRNRMVVAIFANSGFDGYEFAENDVHAVKIVQRKSSNLMRSRFILYDGDGMRCVWERREGENPHELPRVVESAARCTFKAEV